MSYCSECGYRVDGEDKYCRNCGAKLLSSEDIERLRRMLERNTYFAAQSDAQAKRGFLRWLTEIGLGELVARIAGLVWSAIKALFCFG